MDAHAEAVAALEEARAHAERLPAEKQDRRLIDLVVREAHSLHFLGRSLEEATRSGDEALMGRVHRALAVECVYSGRPLDEAVTHGRQAVSLLERTEDRFWLSQALFALSYSCYYSGDFEAALEEAGRRLGDALQAFVSVHSRFEMGRTHFFLASLAYAQGDRELAGTQLKEAHSLFMALRVPKYVERTEQLAREFGVPPIT